MLCGLVVLPMNKEIPVPIRKWQPLEPRDELCGLRLIVLSSHASPRPEIFNDRSERIEGCYIPLFSQGACGIAGVVRVNDLVELDARLSAKILLFVCRTQARGPALIIDIFNHFMPRPYLDRIARLIPDHVAVTAFPRLDTLVDVDARLRLVESFGGLRQVPFARQSVIGSDRPARRGGRARPHRQ